MTIMTMTIMTHWSALYDTALLPFTRWVPAFSSSSASGGPGCTCLVVELRGDVQALGLGKRVIRCQLSATIRKIVDFLQERKFAPLYFFPCWLHISDGSHQVFVLFTCQLDRFRTQGQTVFTYPSSSNFWYLIRSRWSVFMARMTPKTECVIGVIHVIGVIKVFESCGGIYMHYYNKYIYLL